jgi:hypothetical protein
MSGDLPFDRSFAAKSGHVEEVRPGVRRIVAPNPGPFTFAGTNTFLVGRGEVTLIDPGPLDDTHRAAIEAAIDGERLAAMVAEVEAERPAVVGVVGRAGGSLTVNSRFQLNQTVFPASEYGALRELYNQMVAAESEQIVLQRRRMETLTSE